MNELTIERKINKIDYQQPCGCSPDCPETYTCTHYELVRTPGVETLLNFLYNLPLQEWIEMRYSIEPWRKKGRQTEERISKTRRYFTCDFNRFKKSPTGYLTFMNPDKFDGMVKFMNTKKTGS